MIFIPLISWNIPVSQCARGKSRYRGFLNQRATVIRRVLSRKKATLETALYPIDEGGRAPGGTKKKKKKKKKKKNKTEEKRESFTAGLGGSCVTPNFRIPQRHFRGVGCNRSMKLVSQELYFVSIVSLRAEHSGFSRDHKLMHTMHTQIACVVRCTWYRAVRATAYYSFNNR